MMELKKQMMMRNGKLVYLTNNTQTGEVREITFDKFNVSEIPTNEEIFTGNGNISGQVRIVTITESIIGTFSISAFMNCTDGNNIDINGNFEIDINIGKKNDNKSVHVCLNPTFEISTTRKTWKEVIKDNIFAYTDMLNI